MKTLWKIINIVMTVIGWYMAVSYAYMFVTIGVKNVIDLLFKTAELIEVYQKPLE